MTENLPIVGMTCANCANTIQRTLTRRVDGVLEANVSFASESATVTYDDSLTDHAAIAAAVERIGYHVVEPADTAEDAEAEAREAEIRDQSRKFTVGLVFAGPLFAFSMLRDFGLLGHWSHAPWAALAMWAFATPVQFYTGLDYYVGGFKSLRNRSANMDVLVAMGSSAAYLYSVAVTAQIVLAGAEGHVYFETAAVIITLIKLGKLLEVRAKGKAGAAIRRLMGLRSKTARVVRDGTEIDLPIERIVVGDVVVVRPGETIAVDGEIVQGESAVDESMLTGESMPVAKSPGDPATGGTLNKNGLLRVRATRIGSETALARIIRLVQEAQASRAPIQRLADQVSAIFVPAIIVAAAVTFVVWTLVPGSSATHAFVRMVAVLVIACPCALGLATPTAIMVGTGKGAEHGILFKSSEALEKLHAIRTVVLDKTGTITQGEPVVTDVIPADGQGRDDLLRLAGAAERGSEHPLAQAIVRAADELGSTDLSVDSLEAISGHGVRATVGGDAITIGNHRLMASEGIETSGLADDARALERHARTVVWVARDGRAIGVIGIADTVKATSRSAIRRLRDQGVRSVMMTGDNRATADAIASEVGVDVVLAEVLPEDKGREVEKLQSGGAATAMVGDGINDAPALARADVGVAIGTGTDVAMETAGVTLMSGDLHGVPNAIALSRATMRIIKQNLFWAFAYNVTLVPIAAGALASLPQMPLMLRELHPIAAALAMALSSVSVVMNSLRLRLVRIGDASNNAPPDA
ncbi:copper-translocating P-type ATPase [Candidatus Poribacteria bacterium]|nr:copper-translocating P-type ATPase [Candidatus Poribacteria bacterium]